ncbi:hypothetical protein WDW89_17260, partial [Deltaproteobacteria bacterium TL4]
VFLTCPTTVRHSLGTAVCGAACTVVWEVAEKNRYLPDYALNAFKIALRKIVFPFNEKVMTV